jgi:hypothetical protein
VTKEGGRRKREREKERENIGAMSPEAEARRTPPIGGLYHP